MSDNKEKSAIMQKVKNSSILVLVKFGAKWCPPCKAIAPIVSNLISQDNLKDKVQLVDVDIEQEAEFSSLHNVKTIPTIILFFKGKKLDSKTGMQDKKELEQWILDTHKRYVQNIS